MSKSLRYLIPSWAILLAACGGDLLAPGGISSSTLAARVVTPDLSSWPVSASRIDVSWTDNQKNESGWEVHRSTTGATGQFTLLASLGVNATFFSNTGLNERTEYCYRVRSFRKTGPNTAYGAFTSVSCTTTPGRPAAPSNLSALAPDPSTINVSWTDNANDEQTIRVERSTDAAGPWQAVTSLGANVQAFQDHSRPVEQLWCYRVIATNANGESSPSNVDCTAIPQYPPSVSAAADGAAIQVTWTDASNVEDGYEVSRDTEGFAFAVIATLPANTTSFTDAAGAPETRYRYRVRALRDGGGSYYAGYVDAAYAVAPPRAPEYVLAYPAGSTAAGVNSVNMSPSAFEFRFERSTDGGASWVTAGTNTSPGLWDGDRETEREVCYRVYAKNSFGESPASTMDCTRPLAAPSNIEVTYPDDGSILVSWRDNSNFEEQYQIWTELCEYDPYYGDWYCYLWNMFQLDANSTSFSFFPEYGEYVAYVYAYGDGGYSDAGSWGDPPGMAASVSSTNATAKGFVRPVKGARAPAPPLSMRKNGVRKGSGPRKN